MTDLERIISSLEGELLPGQALGARMKRYRVPGFSIALVDGAEVAWARGYGVRRRHQRADGLLYSENFLESGAVSC